MLKLSGLILTIALVLPACMGSDLGYIPPDQTGDDDDDIGGADAGPVAENARVTVGLQALYTFEEGQGLIVADKSGVGAPLDLTIDNPLAVEWIPTGGISVVAPTVMKSAGPADKIGYACMSGNAVTLEAWVRPVAVNQSGPARVLTMADGVNNANFMVGQDNTLSTVRLRTTDTDGNGEPALNSDINVFTSAVVHVAYTRSGLDDEAQTWVNGQLVGTDTVAGNFATWDVTYPLSIANEPNGERPWRGEIYLAAVYCRDLTPTEIFQNYDAGYPGMTGL